MCHGIVDVSGMSEKMMHSVKQFLTPDMRAFWVVCLAYVVFGGSRWFFGHVPGYMVFLVPIFLIIPLVRPKAGLWAIICLTVLFERFFTLEPLQFGRYALKLYPLDLVLLGMFGGVLVRILAHRTKLFLDRSMLFLGIFFGIATLYFLASFLGFGERDLSVALSTWKNYVFYGMLAVVLPQVVVSKRDIRLTVKIFLWSVALGLIFLVIGIARGNGLWTEFTPLSTEGVRLLAFPHAFYFSLAVMTLLVSNDYWDPYRKSGFVWLLMGILMFGILSALMRHIWIGMLLAAGFAFLFFMRQEARKKMIALSCIGIGVGTALFSGVLIIATLFPSLGVSRATNSIQAVVAERIASIGSSADTSISWRGTTWRSALAEIEKHPLLGTGFGRHVAVEADAYHDFVEVRNIHNSWLALFVQMGLLGGFAFVMAFSSVVLALVHLRPYGTLQHSMRVALLSLLVYESLLMLAQPYLETNLLNIPIWITLGLALALVRVAQSNPALPA